MSRHDKLGHSIFQWVDDGCGQLISKREITVSKVSLFSLDVGEVAKNHSLFSDSQLDKRSSLLVSEKVLRNCLGVKKKNTLSFTNLKLGLHSFKWYQTCTNCTGHLLCYIISTEAVGLIMMILIGF